MAESKTAVMAAIAANAAIAVTKFAAAAVTGSSAMISEGVHSIVDMGNGGMLLLGIERSKAPADDLHPFGHGKELYFWTLIVAISIFGIGGGISLYEGIIHVLHPGPIEPPFWNYATLLLAIVFESISGYIALRGFLAEKGPRGWIEFVREGKDPTAYAVLFEDGAALLGLVFALTGIALTQLTQNAVFDGAASIAIGLLLAAVAFVLAGKSKGLLLGECADPKVVRDIERIARADADIVHVSRALTMQMGPNEVVVDLEVAVRPDLDASGLREALRRVERNVRERHPQITHMYVELTEAP